jgi:hypothetical protein
MAPQCTQVPAAHIEPSVQLFPVQQARPCVPQVMVSVPPPSVRSPPVPSVVASGRASVPQLHRNEVRRGMLMRFRAFYAPILPGTSTRSSPRN